MKSFLYVSLCILGACASPVEPELSPVVPSVVTPTLEVVSEKDLCTDQGGVWTDLLELRVVDGQIVCVAVPTCLKE